MFLYRGSYRIHCISLLKLCSYFHINAFFFTGMYFKCDDCHTENTTTDAFRKTFSVGLWQDEHHPSYKNFTLILRGSGTILVPLYLLPDSESFHLITFDQTGSVTLSKQISDSREILKTSHGKSPFTSSNWTNFVISFSEHLLTIDSDGRNVMTFKSTMPLLVYWFSVGVRDGWVTWSVNCEPLNIDGPPVDGGWSKWSPWVCSVPCGGGQGYRTRNCSNPRPNIYGHLCVGSPTSTGTCNDFTCGDISPDTIEKVRDSLKKRSHSLVVAKGDSVIIKNNRVLLEEISLESPDAYYEWTLNGLFLTPEAGHIEFLGDDIVIYRVDVSDTGVYLCMVYRVNKQRLVLQVVTLAITTNEFVIDTRATRRVLLKSNAVVLGYIFNDLKQKWTLNDTVYINHGTTTLAAVSSEDLNPVNVSHSGVWKCIIEQEDLQLSWITNIVKIRVKKKPNLYTNLMEDELTAPIFSGLKSETAVKLLIMFIIVTVCILVSLGVFAYLKWGRLPQVDKGMRKRNRRLR